MKAATETAVTYDPNFKCEFFSFKTIETHVRLYQRQRDGGFDIYSISEDETQGVLVWKTPHNYPMRAHHAIHLFKMAMADNIERMVKG